MTRAQTGVALGMAAGLAGTIAIFIWGALPPPAAFDPPTLEARLLLAATAWLGPLACLTACVGYIANRRFFSPADIDGAGLTAESEAIRVPRAVLANTHEQATLAVIVYAGLAFVLPPGQLALPLALSAAFVVGRAAFAIGYARGAAARSFGFGLTFYPTVGAALWLALALLSRL